MSITAARLTWSRKAELCRDYPKFPSRHTFLFFSFHRLGYILRARDNFPCLHHQGFWIQKFSKKKKKNFFRSKKNFFFLTIKWRVKENSAQGRIKNGVCVYVCFVRVKKKVIYQSRGASLRAVERWVRGKKWVDYKPAVFVFHLSSSTRKKKGRRKEKEKTCHDVSRHWWIDDSKTTRRRRISEIFSILPPILPRCCCCWLVGKMHKYTTSTGIWIFCC